MHTSRMRIVDVHVKPSDVGILNSTLFPAVGGGFVHDSEVRRDPHGRESGAARAYGGVQAVMFHVKHGDYLSW